ncbi:ras-related protein Rab-8A-like [Pomacea canaliculata]|nr:ras-related protein Rab-8A-like [Pomacea canaliculata]
MECARSDKRVLIRIMDTGGQERFRSMTSSYFRGAHGCLLMFDVAKETSFDNIINWFNNLDMYAAPDHISAVLVGTVCQGNERHVTAERAFKLAEGLQLTYMETDVHDVQMVLWILQKLVNNVIISRARRQSLAISIMPPLKMPAKKKRFKCCGAS